MPNNKGNNKKSPVSAFNSGKFKSHLSNLTKTKDNRNQFVIEGLQQGVVVGWVKKSNRDEEAFIGPDIRHLTDNMDVMEKLGINAILVRRGIDGATAMPQFPSGTYDWKQFVFLVGETCNTKEKRSQIATSLVSHFNNNDTTANEYKYPRKMKFFKDITLGTPRPVDSCLLDADVAGLMAAAFPNMELGELATYDDIMKGFWTDINHGKIVMENANVDSEIE